MRPSIKVHSIGVLRSLFFLLPLSCFGRESRLCLPRSREDTRRFKNFQCYLVFFSKVDLKEKKRSTDMSSTSSENPRLWGSRKTPWRKRLWSHRQSSRWTPLTAPPTPSLSFRSSDESPHREATLNIPIAISPALIHHSSYPSHSG